MRVWCITSFIITVIMIMKLMMEEMIRICRNIISSNSSYINFIFTICCNLIIMLWANIVDLFLNKIRFVDLNIFPLYVIIFVTYLFIWLCY